MSFFGKLKSKLFKSSSRLEEGLDAIVEDGGSAEPEPDLTPAQQPSEPPAPRRADIPAAPAPDVTPPAEPIPTSPVERPAPRPIEAPPRDDPAPDLAPSRNPGLRIPPPRDPAPQPVLGPVAPLREVPAPAPDRPSGIPREIPPKPGAGPGAVGGGVLGRLFKRGDGAPVMRRTLDDDMLEQIEELLIAADMGVDTALRVTANMAEGRMGRKVSTREI
jgi:fused signal recognition particle receptor